MIEELRFRKDDPRLRQLNDRPTASRGEFVLYWSQVYRRARDNAALAYAVERANELGVPCVVYEALRPDYPHASARIHQFVLEGARDAANEFAARGIAHYFFLPRTPSDAKGVVAQMMARACLVVSDDYPSFVVPHHNERGAAKAPCSYVVVDDCAVVPMALVAKAEVAARTLRPKLMRALPEWLRPLHDPDPRVGPPARLDLPFDPVRLADAPLGDLVRACAIDQAVPPVAQTQGGSVEANRRLNAFVEGPFGEYDEARNDPSKDSVSRLSPYLHFGMISARAAALRVQSARGGRSADAFIEQLVVRRGLSFNFARSRPDHAEYSAVPAWARATLEAHERDRRYADLTLSDLENARSPDALWNASMRELRERGVVQPYARMLWGKLPILWMRTASAAHSAMATLNDRWALDGRDPNGYANVSWCFGLHDRPWPERPVFGNVRSMTSASAQKKLDFAGYLRRYGGP